MIDIVYLAFNRLKYTQATVAALQRNTDWTQVRRVYVYDDGSTDGTREFLQETTWPAPAEMLCGKFGGPVAIMVHYLTNFPTTPMFAKIDNDTMLPPEWLTECLRVMDKSPELGLLGIEAFNEIAAGRRERSYTPCRWIGGIGLMRREIFRNMPRPNGLMGRFGFTQWQRNAHWTEKGWIDPSLPVFLLDKIGWGPWKSIRREYEQQGWQRQWPEYTQDQATLWEWWNENEYSSGPKSEERGAMDRGNSRCGEMVYADLPNGRP